MEIYNVGISVPKKSDDKFYVYITDESGKIIKKFYKGINAFKTDAERLSACNVAKAKIEEEIKNGWNPALSKSALPQPYNRYLNIIDAYGKALELIQNSDLSDSTKKDYKSHHKYFTEAVHNLKWKNELFVNFEAYHFTLILQEMIRSKKTAINPNAYFNKHLEIVKSFCTTLKRNHIAKENKAHGIPQKKHRKKQRETLTPEEQTKVINHFKILRPSFITFLKVLYHLGIREKEMMLITCGMIDTKTWSFHLPEEITKNGKGGIVLIPDDIKKDLEKLDLSNPGHYLFGIPTKRSKWNEQDQFKPSPFQMARSTGTRLWKSEVKDKLGIQKDLYSLKHKGANDKLRNGMQIGTISTILRHSEEKITDIYATHRNIIEQENNIEKFGDFK